MPIDESRTFLPVNIAVLTVSDTRDLASDRSGDTLAERIAKAGHRLAAREICKDEPAEIEAILRRGAGFDALLDPARLFAGDGGVDALNTLGLAA